jgi:small subunit ribosomal protein S4
MKRKGKIARFKLQRRLLVELPGLGKAGALERKPYPPGQHGGKRIKYSDFRLQLEEKQKIRLHYGLREEQLVRLVKLAKRKAEGRWAHALINILEKRLDNMVFRAGLAPSIPAARQLVSHGKILVNGKRVNIRSYTVKASDEISLKEKAINNQVYQQAKQSPRLPLPDWIVKSETDLAATVRLQDEPGFEAVPLPLDEGLVTSYYSKV